MRIFNPFSLTVGTTPTVLGNSTVTFEAGVLLVADSGNSGKVYYGYANTVTPGTTAATDGIQLSPGASAFVPKGKAANASQIYLVGSAASQKTFIDPQ